MEVNFGNYRSNPVMKTNVKTQSKNSLTIQGKDTMALGYTDHRRPFLNTFAQMTKTISRPGFSNKMEYLKYMVFIKYHTIMVYVL